MGLLNIFRRNNKIESLNNVSNNGAPLEPKLIAEKDFATDTLYDISEGISSESINSRYISRVFNYLNKDFESVGYNDALTNADEKFRDDNIEILKKNYLILLKEAAFAFNEYLRELDAHIVACTNSQLTDTITQLQTRKTSTDDTLKFIREQTQEITDENGTAVRIILSYKRGFSKGIAALAQARIINKHI
jgi:hypothetical protein